MTLNMIEDRHGLHLAIALTFVLFHAYFLVFMIIFLICSWVYFIRSNIQDDIPAGSPNTVVKGKVSRTPRTGSVMGLDSSPNIYHSSGAFQGWEQVTGLNKVPVVGATNNQRRMMSTGSSMHPMTQWVGQRPHKNSRTRRANLVSPVSNNAEAQISSQGLASTDFSAKLSSAGTNGPLPSSSVDNNTPKVKREYENVSSPFGLSESEESGAVENKIKGKGVGNGGVALAATHKAGTFVLPTKKNKMLSNEIGDGVERQGRNGRGSSLTRPGVPPAGEKLENISMTKPPQSVRTSSEKNRRFTQIFSFCIIALGEHKLSVHWNQQIFC